MLAALAGFRLPIETVPLQAFVSEPIAPHPRLRHHVQHRPRPTSANRTRGNSSSAAASDPFVSYSQRGSFDQIEHVVAPIIELYPIFSRVNMLRQWAGIVDITPDRSPLLSETPVRGLFFNCGWGTGGFKATPGSGDAFAETLALGHPGRLAAPYSLQRFVTGELVDEAAAAAVAH